MKNRILLLIISILSIIAYKSSQKETTFFDEPKKEIAVTIKDSKTSEVQEMKLEEYIVGVVAGEMPASFDPEALKAQAVAARTYAVYKVETSNATYDLVTDVSNQVYINKDQMKDKWGSDFEKYYKKINKAIDDTKGIIMEYNGEVISSYYFAMSNGSTEDVSLVFGESKDYLKSVDSSWEKNITNFENTISFSKEDFCQKLGIECSSINIKNINKSSSGRVNTIDINEKTFKGTDIRKTLNLRSTDFEISIDDDILITTKGYGHGVGMSQYGANEMAKQGYSYDEILKYYYQNVELTKLNV